MVAMNLVHAGQIFMSSGALYAQEEQPVASMALAIPETGWNVIDLSEDSKNVFPSIDVNSEFVSNQFDESEEQYAKQDEEFWPMLSAWSRIRNDQFE
jgi:hypothetical protein